MKKITLLFCLAMSIAVNAQDYSVPDALSFEPANGKAGGYWWIRPEMRDKVSVTDEKAAEGKYSLKFACSDFGTVDAIDAQLNEKMKGQPLFNLEPGKYKMSVKFYLCDSAPVGINTNIISSATKSFIPVNWKFKNQPKNEWFEVSQDVDIVDGKSLKLAVKVSAKPNWGGTGTIYVDAIKFEKL